MLLLLHLFFACSNATCSCSVPSSPPVTALASPSSDSAPALLQSTLAPSTAQAPFLHPLLFLLCSAFYSSSLLCYSLPIPHPFLCSHFIHPDLPHLYLSPTSVAPPVPPPSLPYNLLAGTFVSIKGLCGIMDSPRSGA